MADTSACTAAASGSGGTVARRTTRVLLMDRAPDGLHFVTRLGQCDTAREAANRDDPRPHAARVQLWLQLA